MDRELQGYTMEDRNYMIFTYTLLCFCFSASCNGITFVNFTVLQVHIDDIATPLSSGINMNIETNSVLDCTRQCSSDLSCASVMYTEANELKCRKFLSSMTLIADVVVPFVGSGSVILASKMNILVPEPSTTTTEPTTTTETTTVPQTTTTTIVTTTTAETIDCAGEVYDETDYPTRIVDGESWRPFWWYNSTIGWPLDETDTLGAPFRCCNPAALHCFGRLPQYLIEDQTELLAVDSAGNAFRWAFDSSNPTAHAVWQAFHDHQQTAYGDVRNSDEWEPIVVQGGPYRRRQDSFMYREEHGVASFMLDDDNCECYASLHAGHGMCSGGFSANIGTKNVFGVGLLDRNNCDIGDGPSPSHELYLFYLATVAV